MQKESCKIYERYSNTPGEIAKELFYYPQWAGRFVCKNDFYIDRSALNSILIICTDCGSGKLIYRGEEYILNKNTFALINCMDRHIYFPTHENWSFRFLHFGGKNIADIYEHIFSVSGPVFPAKKGIYETVNKCISICRDKPSMGEALASKHISTLIYDILFACVGKEKDGISLVCDYIAENYNKRLTTKKLAEISCFSRCYFSTVFKRVTGRSLHDYLICYRLDKAKELLADSSVSVSEIAEKCGFGDLGTFIRAFKKKENITPLQFRKEYNKK